MWTKMIIDIRNFIVLFSVLKFPQVLAQDPCTLVDRLTLYREKYRGTLCETRSWKSVTEDLSLKEGWVRVNGINGPLTMPTTTVPMSRCSTKFPIWMKGQHPLVSDDIVNRTCCIVAPLSNCENNITIQVKNCTDFIAYYLKAPAGSEEAYCFGEGENCPPEDPCEDYDRRDLNIHVNTCSDNRSFVCDKPVVDSWYILRHSSNPAIIPTSCPRQKQCGSAVQFWINGTLPSDTGAVGVVKENTLCMKTHDSCCNASYPIQTKKCDGFMVYKLQSFSCPLHICHDNQSPCDAELSTHPINYNNSSSVTLNKDNGMLALVIVTAVLMGFF